MASLAPIDPPPEPPEWVSPLVHLQHTEQLGYHLVAAADIELGALLVRAFGYEFSDGDEERGEGDAAASFLATVALRWHVAARGSVERQRLEQLAPRHLHADPEAGGAQVLTAEEMQKLKRDHEALVAICACVEEAWRGGMSAGEEEEEEEEKEVSGAEPRLEDVQLMQVKLGRNMFHCGLFPLACFFNHSCAHNCNGTLTVLESGDGGGEDDGDGVAGGLRGDDEHGGDDGSTTEMNGEDDAPEAIGGEERMHLARRVRMDVEGDVQGHGAVMGAGYPESAAPHSPDSGPTVPVFEVRALCTIPRGQQLCINYLPETLRYAPTLFRRQLLQRQYGFLCVCTKCTQADPAWLVGHVERREPSTAASSTPAQPLAHELEKHQQHERQQCSVGGEAAEERARLEQILHHLSHDRAGENEAQGDSPELVQWLTERAPQLSPSHHLLYLATLTLRPVLRDRAQTCARQDSPVAALVHLFAHIACCATVLRCLRLAFHSHDPAVSNALSSMSEGLRAWASILSDLPPGYTEAAVLEETRQLATTADGGCGETKKTSGSQSASSVGSVGLADHPLALSLAVIRAMRAGEEEWPSSAVHAIAQVKIMEREIHDLLSVMQ